MSNASLSLFETLGVTPQLGRLPTPEEGSQAAVISHRLWQDWFGGDPSVIGRSYSMAGAMRTVVGVMPLGFDFPSEDVVLWIPNGLDAAGAAISPGQFGLRLVARVRPGVEPEALIAQLELIASRLPEQYGGPTTYTEIIERFVPRVVPLKEELLGPLEGPLWILLGAMSILLVIAGANVANLFLVRAERQRRDVAIRRAIGAPTAGADLSAARRDDDRRRSRRRARSRRCRGDGRRDRRARAAPGAGPAAGAAVERRRAHGHDLLFTFVVSVALGLACGIMPAARAAGVNLAWLRDTSRGSTQAATGRATGSSSRKQRSRCYCSSAPACCYAASPSSAASTPATSRRTFSRSKWRRSRRN